MNKKPTMHHFRCPTWMSEALREVGESTGQSDSELIRKAVADHLAKYGKTEAEFFFNQNNDN